MVRRDVYAERRKTYPRAECPVLIGLTSAEAAVLSKAAKLCETPRATFVRDAALYQAETLIKAQKGGK